MTELDKLQQVQQQHTEALATRRARRHDRAEFRTANAFIRALEARDHATRCAWVRYLADRWKIGVPDAR